MRKQGLSLVEIIIALAVLGILLAVGSVSLINYQRTLQMRQGIATIVADLNRARSQSRKSSQDWQLILTRNQGSYQIQRSGQPSQTVMLPSGVRIGDIGATPLAIQYSAPYGLRPLGSSSLSIPILGPNNRSGRINIVGIMGKVVVVAN